MICFVFILSCLNLVYCLSLIWEILSDYLLKYFFCPNLSPFSFWDFNYTYVRPSVIVPHILLSLGLVDCLLVCFYSLCYTLINFYWPSFKFMDFFPLLLLSLLIKLLRELFISDIKVFTSNVSIFPVLYFFFFTISCCLSNSPLVHTCCPPFSLD